MGAGGLSLKKIHSGGRYASPVLWWVTLSGLLVEGFWSLERRKARELPSHREFKAFLGMSQFSL